MSFERGMAHPRAYMQRSNDDFSDVSSLLSLVAPGYASGCWAWRQAPLHTKPTHWLIL